MNLLNTQNRINELMARFVAQVKGSTAMSRTDINNVSENLLIPLFSFVFDLAHLKNLNLETNNYPGIDLGDEYSRISFQITASNENDKIKHSLEQFHKYELYKKYDKIIIYIISEKQKRYSQKPLEDIINKISKLNSKFSFDCNSDIQDYTDMLSKISGFPLEESLIIKDILENNFGDQPSRLPIKNINQKSTESVFLNFLEFSFPDKIYIADTLFEVNNDFDEELYPRKGNRSPIRHHKYFKSPSDQVREVLSSKGLRFSADWICHNNQILTFHDLYDESKPIYSVIDPGTITSLEPSEYYEISGDHERVFKSLLNKCLQQKLYRRGVSWQYERKCFVFSEIDEEAKRKEEWYGKKKSDRTVFERTMKNNKPDEILICKHLAFEVQFKRFGPKWYVVIVPDWFFSRDGYKSSDYGAEKVTWLKKKENNQQVFNHVRFISYFLTNETSSTLFHHVDPYPFLQFKNLVRFDNAPFLNDKDWLPGENEKTRKRLQQDDDFVDLSEDSVFEFEVD